MQLSFHLPGLLYIYYFWAYYVLLLLVVVSRAMCDVFIHSRRTNCSIWDKTSHWIIDQVCDEFQELSADNATWPERNIYNGKFQGPGKEKCNVWPYPVDKNKEKNDFCNFLQADNSSELHKNLLWWICGAQPDSTDLYSVQSTCFRFKTVLISFVSQDKKFFFVFIENSYTLKQEFEQL